MAAPVPAASATMRSAVWMTGGAAAASEMAAGTSGGATSRAVMSGGNTGVHQTMTMLKPLGQLQEGEQGTRAGEAEVCCGGFE
jgi:hypothetical protein